MAWRLQVKEPPTGYMLLWSTYPKTNTGTRSRHQSRNSHHPQFPMNKPTNLVTRPVFLRIWKSLSALCALLAFGMLSPVSIANPVSVTYGGTVYDITYYLGTFNTQPSGVSLQSQVWFGDAAVAADFASLIGGSLGFENFGSQSPYFVYSLGSSGTTWAGSYYDNSGFVSSHFTVPTEGWLGRFAYVTASSPAATPDGGTSLGLMFIALAAMGIARLRQKSAVA